MTTQKTKTKAYEAKLAQKRNELEAHGINLRELCDANHIDYQTARSLLCGKILGRRGKAHKVAVFLGLKPNPEQLAA